MNRQSLAVICGTCFIVPIIMLAIVAVLLGGCHRNPAHLATCSDGITTWPARTVNIGKLKPLYSAACYESDRVSTEELGH